MGDAVRDADGRIDPFPAFGADGVRLAGQALGHEPDEQRRILAPAAIVILEQVAHHDAAGGLIGVDADEDGAFVRGAHRGFSQYALDLPRLLLPAVADRLPHLFLPGVILRYREGHELLQLHAVLGENLQQFR